MAVQRCRWRTNINTTMRRWHVIDGNTTRKISHHIITCTMNDETRRDDDPWAGVVDQSQWDYAGLQVIDSSTSSDSRPRIRRSTKTAELLCFIIFSRFLALNSQVGCGTNTHPLPASNYKAHVLLIKNHYYGWWLATRMNCTKSIYILFEIYFINIIEHNFIKRINIKYHFYDVWKIVRNESFDFVTWKNA